MTYRVQHFARPLLSSVPERYLARHSCPLPGAYDRHFGDATNRAVTVAFSGTSVTVLKALGHEGQ